MNELSEAVELELGITLSEIKFGLRGDTENWTRGAWEKEPDHLVWYDEETQLPCMIHRNSLGTLCGYVGVPEGSKHFGKHCDDIDIEGESYYGPDVHGGLTYADKCEGELCHTPQEGEPERWWLGFDCGHCGDITPALGDTLAFIGGVYQTIGYVKLECEKLARQLVG